MPLARHIRAVASIANQIDDRDNVLIQVALISWLSLLFLGEKLVHVAQSATVVINAGHQQRPRRRTGSTDVEVRKSQTIAGESINIWRRDLAAIHPEIRKPHIIANNQENVRVLVNGGINRNICAGINSGINARITGRQ